MSIAPYFSIRCFKCLKPVQMVWGSAEWHRANDPLGGYCRCPTAPPVSAAE